MTTAGGGGLSVMAVCVTVQNRLKVMKYICVAVSAGPNGKVNRASLTE